MITYQKFESFKSVPRGYKNVLKYLILENGEMWNNANSCVAPTVIAFCDNIPVGWSIINDYYEINVFVESNYRRKGIGKKLVNLINENREEIATGIAHDFTSFKFYRAMNYCDIDYWNNTYKYVVENA